jgi:hypothetical protein
MLATYYYGYTVQCMVHTNTLYYTGTLNHYHTTHLSNAGTNLDESNNSVSSIS